MTGIAKLTQHKAHGTSLLAIVFTALAAATYYYHGAADWLSPSCWRSLRS
jgi:uncharacterized membrane protein YfcA